MSARDQTVSGIATEEGVLDRVAGKPGLFLHNQMKTNHWLAAGWTFPFAVLKFRMNIVVYQDDHGNGAGNTEMFTWKEGGDAH
jgi:hypothetical protein